MHEQAGNIQDPQSKRINKLLVSFGEKLKCDQKYYDDGNNLANEVFNTLHQKCSDSLASFHIGGSFGKKTDVIEPDLDLVVLVNNCHPPLERILNHFEDILRSNEDNLQIMPNRYKKTELSLNFSFTNGITVDLLPAANIKPHEKVKVFKEMKHHEYAYFYNPSFVKDQIAFMQSQDSFTHTLIRLSKFWLKSLYLGESFTGGSAMMELMGVASAESECEFEEKSTLRAFLRVLDTVMNLRSTKLAFIHYSRNGSLTHWKRVSPHDLKHRTKGIVPQVVGKDSILSRKRFMIDPANPFQDYLKDKTESVLEKLNKFARATRHRVQMILNGHGIYGQDIQTLFEPMPNNDAINDTKIFFPKNVLFTLCQFSEPSVHNEVYIWNDKIYGNKKTRRAIEILKNNLLVVVRSSVKGASKQRNQQVVNVKNAVYKWIGNSSKMRLKTAIDSNANSYFWAYDATVLVPLTVDNTCYTICLSMTWNPVFPAVKSNDGCCVSKNCCEFFTDCLKILLILSAAIIIIYFLTKSRAVRRLF